MATSYVSVRVHNAEMGAAWMGLVGAVIGGMITGGFSLWAVVTSGRRSDRAMLKDRRRVAYSEFHGACGLVLFTASSVRMLLAYHSGLNEGLGVLTHTRTPLSAIDIDGRFRQDLIPLYLAASRITAIGSHEANAIAGKIVTQVGVVIRTATEPGKARGKLATLLRGFNWTTEQEVKLGHECDKLLRLRGCFVDLARNESNLQLLGPENV